MEVSWRLAVTMFSVHIEILLWYGMFRVAEMHLISMAFRHVGRDDHAKKDPRYRHSESLDVDLFSLFQEHVFHPITSAQYLMLERLCEMDLEASEKGTNPDPFVGYGR